MIQIGSIAAAGPVSELIVQRRDGVAVRLHVEFAGDAHSRGRGLMKRQYLAPRTGMVFDFERRRRVHMWMKNTLIPLDILFITESGEVIQIKHQATPRSSRLITSRHKVRYVVEINGGEAEELGFALGDRVLLQQWSQSRHGTARPATFNDIRLGTSG
ncbi:MAG TPA: DUF192 domain-containing protein [Candidatus Marinimicrobia bacterium]|nr:DUF192 domain-containing protein [Candidatus Neomarinimicrobiota bacterium]